MIGWTTGVSPMVTLFWYWSDLAVERGSATVEGPMEGGGRDGCVCGGGEGESCVFGAFFLSSFVDGHSG